MYLVIVDTVQIQSYVFGSNRLRENIGASHLVAQATETRALETVRTLAIPSNVNLNGTLDNTKRIEDSATNLAAEVLYAGGGNVVVLFRNEADVKTFARQLSRTTLIDAPNLQLVIAHQPCDWNHSLHEQVEATRKKLAEKKRARSFSTPLLGLGVTVMCRSTGLAAQEIVQPIPTDLASAYPASAEIVAKLDAAAAANERLRTMFKAVLGDTYTFPRDFDELGRSEGKHSYIAVIHVDGNEMGERIRQTGKSAKDNRDYISRLRAFSQAVEAGAQAALKAVLRLVVGNIRNGKISHPTLLQLAVPVQHLLPLRPIVFGGDDVTFVCDGRLGLSLAVEYLRQFENETAKRADCNGKITACAGIAIVKTHYPFARAYTLAEELCKSAKIYRRKQNLDGSCLDWHFAFSGLAGDIEEIRRREYTVKEGSLTLRPLTLDQNIGELQRAWGVVQEGIIAFQGDGWAGRRNKVKALRDTLREGRDAVKLFLTKFNEDNHFLPSVEPSMTNWPTEGWQGGYCGYFDAIELADWFIPLQGGQVP